MGLGVGDGSSSESWARRWPERVSESGLRPGMSLVIGRVGRVRRGFGEGECVMTGVLGLLLVKLPNPGSNT